MYKEHVFFNSIIKHCSLYIIQGGVGGAFNIISNSYFLNMYFKSDLKFSSVLTSNNLSAILTIPIPCPPYPTYPSHNSVSHYAPPTTPPPPP